MKFLMLSMLLFGSLTSFAATEIAKYRFGTDSKSNDDVYRIYEASLNTIGQLKVTFKEYEGENWDPTMDTEVDSGSYMTVISDVAFELLESIIQYNSRTKIKVGSVGEWCQILPSPVIANDHLSLARAYDSESNTYKNPMILVAGPEGCWVQVPTRPYSMQDFAALKQLTGMIKILALNI